MTRRPRRDKATWVALSVSQSPIRRGWESPHGRWRIFETDAKTYRLLDLLTYSLDDLMEFRDFPTLQAAKAHTGIY